jgi:hypothetical protein
MTDEYQIELNVGLSDGEKKDLEKLIAAFRENKSSAPPDKSAEDVHSQIKSMSAKLAQFGDILLKFDTKIKSFYEILLLSYKKSEMMNQRIDTIIEIMKNQKNP